MFVEAYQIEQEGYFQFRESLHEAATLTKLQKAHKLFLQADSLYIDAYADLKRLVHNHGLTWEDIKQ